METAALVGLNILTFWELTPKEFYKVVEAYCKRQKQEAEEKITIAYMTAYWQRVKKLESLKQVLKKLQPKKKMTEEEMFKVVEQLNAMFGGEVR